MATTKLDVLLLPSRVRGHRLGLVVDDIKRVPYDYSNMSSFKD